MNFKEMLGDAFPLIEKFAPVVAAAFTIMPGPVASFPLIRALAAIRILADIFKPDHHDYSLEELERLILKHPDPQKMLQLADEKLLKHLEEKAIPAE